MSPEVCQPGRDRPEVTVLQQDLAREVTRVVRERVAPPERMVR